MIANLTGVSYSVPMDTALSVYLIPIATHNALLVRDLKSEGASGFSKYYIEGKKSLIFQRNNKVLSQF